jgi:hypothetical protein
VGPVVIYQPIKKRVPENLVRLTANGVIELRAPLTRDDDRLCAALAELIDWGRMNPGRSAAEANILRTAQPRIPFFDDTAVSRIRSELRRCEAAAGPELDRSEAQFNARLFLALAQENDLAGESLDQHLSHFQTLTTAFLEHLPEADGAAFNRQNRWPALGQEDPGARLTGQRMRAWATLAAADPTPPGAADHHQFSRHRLAAGGTGRSALARKAGRDPDFPPTGRHLAPLLLRPLAALAARPTGSTEGLADLTALDRQRGSRADRLCHGLSGRRSTPGRLPLPDGSRSRCYAPAEMPFACGAPHPDRGGGRAVSNSTKSPTGAVLKA